MLNFTKDNLIAVPKEDVTAGSSAIMVNDMVLLLQRGVDVSDTTATAPDVLEGKKFYDADGQPTIGTLVQGGGSTSFYKCESVSTNTWSGYKAYTYTDTEDNKEYYAFEENLTTDTLTYGDGFTPVVGGIYDAEAMVKAELWMKVVIPTNGLDFYFPLDSDLAEKIHNLSPNTDYDTTKFYITEDAEMGGCLRADNGDSDFYYNGTENLMQYGENDFSFSLWLKAPAWADGWINMLLIKGDNPIAYNEPGVPGYMTGVLKTDAVLDENWHYFTWVREDGSFKQYRDGELKYSYDAVDGNSSSNMSNSGYFGFLTDLTYWSYGQGLHANWYMKALRIYNRALTEDEIQQLYHEFSA